MSGVIASMLILNSSFQNASNQVSPVNAATLSTSEIVGTLILAGMMMLALIYLDWVNISKAGERIKELGHLDAMAICHILCTFLFLLQALRVVDLMCFYLSLL